MFERTSRRSAAIGAVAFVLCLLAVLSGVPMAAMVTGTTPQPLDESTTAHSEGSEDDALTFDYTFERLVERPGFVRVSVTTTAPDRVTSVTIRPPPGATVEGTTGYEDTGDGGELVWRDLDRAEATVSYITAVNETDDAGRLKEVDTGRWALFQWRSVDLRWSYTRRGGTQRPTVLERPAGTVGPGAVGPGVAYLGPYREATRTVDGERIRVVEPDAADTAETSAAIADALAAASGNLRIGARNERVMVVVAPEPIAVTGRMVRAGSPKIDDMYVRADEPLATADHAWFHEYVHTRQEYETSPRVAWLDDGSAEYYGAWLAYESGFISSTAFYQYVRTDRNADAILSDASGADGPASYFKGMRVLAAADAEIRAGSGGTATLQDVMASVNRHDDTVTLDVLAAAMDETADGQYSTWLERYTTTTEVPSVPTYLESPGSDGVPSDTVPDVPITGLLLFVAAAILAAVVLFDRSRPGR